MDDIDLVVIGSGQGGIPLAVDRARAGQRVVLFERGELGGTCVNNGCTPSKAFLASAHNAGRARLAAPLGVHAEVRVDQRAVLERVRRVRREWNEGLAPRLRNAGVQLVRAQAEFTGERTVRGGNLEFRATTVVIDTGTRAALPPVDGLDRIVYLTNETFFDQIELPRRLIVIGGGYVGLELGQGARRLGAEVTIVHGAERVLEREEPEASEALRTGLERDGVRLVLQAQAKAAEPLPGGGVCVVLASGERLEGDAVLVATGRAPNTAALHAERSQVQLDARGFVATDDYLRTTCEGVYALGDVAGQPQFTHVSWEDFRRLRATLGGNPRRKDDRVLSYSTFTEPQVARAGFTVDEAKKRGIDADARTIQLTDVARGPEWDLELGFYRLVVDRASGKIIGATLVGYEAGEIIHTLGLAIHLGATWRNLDDFVGIHPTFGEGLPSLARLFE